MRGTAACCLLSLAACAAGAEVTVRLIEPSAGLPVFGEVGLVAEARGDGEEVLWVEFSLDGRPLARLAEPPWRTTVEIETPPCDGSNPAPY